MPPLRVLLVKTSSMGDVVHALPVVHDILAAHPDASIDWLVENSYAPVVRCHPGVARVIGLSWRRWRKRWWSAESRQAWGQLRAELAQQKYDAIIDLQGLVKSALLARLAAGTHYGLSWGSAREAAAALFYSRRQHSALGRTEAAVQRCRALAGWALGYVPQGRPQYGLQVFGQPHWRPAGNYAVLLSATAKARKLWSESNWVELALQLRARGLTCVFAWGNGEEQERAERLAAAVNADTAEPRALAAPQAFALDIWMQVLANASLVVGVDTGLLYLGAAVGTPAVAIYTGSAPRSVAFDSAAPWRSLGDDGCAPSLEAVSAAAFAVLAEAGA